MNPFEMVVLIVAVVMIASVLKARYNSKNGFATDEDGNPVRFDDQESKQLKSEIKRLNDRIAVLERLATDGRESSELAREIEDLRSR